MTPEQLEAHRVRFEQQFYAVYGFEPCRSGPAYGEGAACDAWQLYQRVLADADRAQRAAPGVQGGEVRFGGRCEKHLSPKPCAACAQPPQQSAQPSMQDALAAGDGTLHGAIDYWQAKCAELEAKLAQSAQPAAWACWLDDEDMDKCSPSINKEEPKAYSKRRALVYAAAQPVEAANGWEKGLDIRMSQGWKLKGGICPVLYTDTVNGYGVVRDDLWLATTEALKSAQLVEVQRVGLTNAEAHALVDAAKNSVYSHEAEDLAIVFAVEAHHGIKPTSSEGGT